MKLQILSDLHMELWPSGHYVADDIPVTAPYLALCGDIGDPEDAAYVAFIHALAGRYRAVFLVLGNHEHYGGGRCIEETAALVAHIAASAPSKNVHLMDRTAVHLEEENVTVLGTTLWSDVLDEQRSDVGCFIQDYRRIRDWSIHANNWRHAQDVHWLEVELRKAKGADRRVVVLTHHAPATGFTSAPEHRGGPLSSAFETDLRRLLVPPVALWACGHTHHSFDVRLNNGVRVVANQVGYPGEEGLGDPDLSYSVEL